MTAKNDRMRDLIAEEVADLFDPSDPKQLRRADDENLLTWLLRSPAHVAEYLAMARLDRDIARAARKLSLPPEQELLKEVAHTNVVEFAPNLNAADERRRPWSLPGIAAALGLLAATAFGSIHLARLDGAVADRGRYSTSHGEGRTWRLADDTVVHLDSDSTIHVRFDDQLRVVEVERGQAYFEVAKDPRRQFRVHVGDMILLDIGTAFNVFRKNAGVSVTVVEGQVAIWKNHQMVPSTALPTSAPLANLKAGQRITVMPSGRIEKEITPNPAKAIAWTRQEIAFDNDTIANVAAEFNRYNDLQLQVVDPAVANITVGGVFRTYDVRSFIQFLNAVPGVQTVKTGNTVTVGPRPIVER